MSKALNISLIKQALITKAANARQSTSSTKTRGQVSGGGKKPWRQKGTGRARAGSSRSPVWVGGGITFGPHKDRNHKIQLPKRMARAALEQLLTYYQDNKQLVIVDSLALKAVKTKEAITLLKTHGADGKKTLLVTSQLEPELLISCRNIPGVLVTINQNLSIKDVAAAQIVLFDKESAMARALVKAAPAVKKPAVKKEKVTK